MCLHAYIPIYNIDPVTTFLFGRPSKNRRGDTACRAAIAAFAHRCILGYRRLTLATVLPHNILQFLSSGEHQQKSRQPARVQEVAMISIYFLRNSVGPYTKP